MALVQFGAYQYDDAAGYVVPGMTDGPAWVRVGATFNGQPVFVQPDPVYGGNWTPYLKNPRWGAPYSAEFDARRVSSPPFGWQRLQAGVHFPVERPAPLFGRFLYTEPFDEEQERIWQQGILFPVVAPNVLDPVSGAVLGPTPGASAGQPKDEYIDMLESLIARLTGRARRR